MNSDEVFRFAHLECALSPRIGDLTFLTVLTWPIEGTLTSGNVFSGPLPDSRYFPDSLEVLDLSHNQFFAPIPATLCSLKNLKFLKLENNNITGRIPIEIENLQNLRYLHLGNNKMHGELPKSLGNLKMLLVLELQHNKFHGELPTELGRLKRLRSLYLNSNRFIGDLNSDIFENMPSLLQLALNRNQFTGDFPHSLLATTRLRILRLENNYFSESVSWDDFPFTLKAAIKLKIKQFKVSPQREGPPPHQILPEYSEFSSDLVHPSDIQSNRHSRHRHRRPPPDSIYDLPENIAMWSPEEVAFWVGLNGGDKETCETIEALQIAGWQFFRFQQEDLESALGVGDDGIKMLLFCGIQRELALVNGLVPPIYEK
ncbi:hypothetical protein BDR26DRAFT_879848 [Obelidium mucronatum]|nr:hypothetical protein BDR26DRAFT_879848 [Obelidium mucronatum]